MTRLQRETAKNGDVFEIKDSAIDATIGGFFGWTPDTERRMVRGTRTYRINGRPVNAAEFDRRRKATMFQP